MTEVMILTNYYLVLNTTCHMIQKAKKKISFIFLNLNFSLHVLLMNGFKKLNSEV